MTQPYFGLRVQQALVWQHLGEFEAPSDALAIASTLDEDFIVVSREEAEQIAEGKATFHSLPAELKVELARRCAIEVGNRDAEEMWTRCLTVIVPHKKLTIDKARRRHRSGQ